MITKQTQDISFAKGLDQKRDPWRVGPQNFLELTNSIFLKEGLLQKRNGFPTLITSADLTGITTFQNFLVGLTTEGLFAYDPVLPGFITPPSTQQPIVQCNLSVVPIFRNSLNQIQCDSAVAANGFVCTAYTQNVNGTLSYWYTINDSATGENVLAPTQFTAITSARVFLLGTYFIILYTTTGSPDQLTYIAINTATLVVNTAVNLVGCTPNSTTNLAFDGIVVSGSLIIVFDAASSLGIQYITLTSNLIFGSPLVVDNTHTASIVSVTTDSTNLYFSYFNSSDSKIYMSAYVLNTAVYVFGPITIDTGVSINNLTSVAIFPNQVVVYYEIINAYGFDASFPTHFIKGAYVFSGSPQTPFVLVRGVGLASKPVLYNGLVYLLAAYSSNLQNTYFLLNTLGNPTAFVVSKFAYENGGGYTLGCSNITVIGDVFYVPYLFKDFIVSQNLTPASVNKNPTNVAQVSNIYSQTGVNLAIFTLPAFDTPYPFVSSELGSNLNLIGGFLWMFDGTYSVENNFFVFPDADPNINSNGSSKQLTVSNSGGSMTTQNYYYQTIYTWTDAQGNKFRSAPSLPVAANTADFSGSSNSVTVNIPTLRLTFKTNVTIEVFRWSANQQNYYAIRDFASIPLLNDPTVDSISIVDPAIDSSIIGNELIYTTGGVVEDTSGPACSACTIFDTRLWVIDSEDPNLLWYSKQVIEATPVEMSDLFTYYISPSISAQGSTGPLTCIAPMDDKLIIFKKDAIYYINGTGPDITGSNNQYSQPIFITSTVGSSIQNSIVIMPLGLMFQSDKGIWLLGRDLSTQYIGAPVENLTTGQTVVNVQCIPETNQVRFVMSNGIILLYDYYFGQWGTFQGMSTNSLISSCLFNGLQTLLDSSGNILQESPGVYLDSIGVPVLMSFQTAWFNLTGLQGYQRAYFFYLLGQYLSPHNLSLGIAYDYDPTVTQTSLIAPLNTVANTVEQWRIFLAKQRCESFQINLSELYTTAPGAGLTLSGINLVYGMKKAFRTISAANTVGGGTNTG